MKFFLGSMGVLVVGGGLYWFLGMEKDSVLLSNDVNQATEQEVAEAVSGGSITETSDGEKQYVHGERGFAFRFGGDLTVTTLPDLDGEILLLRDSESGREFQIYATYFDEEGPITASRIKADLPDLKIEEPQAVKIGTEKSIDALIFTGESEDFGRTREVWFMGGGQLFQVITNEGNDGFIGPILDTWEFQE